MSASRPLAAASLLAALVAAAPGATAAAETVRFDTVFGAFDVELFEEETPLHTANFLEFVDAGDFDSSIIHRSSPGFVIQGGLATFDGEPVADPSELPTIESRGTVLNEPGISNTRGTIALARVGGQENSGTSQFFFNLDDNLFLDDVDGGFTVFGEIVDQAGLDIIDQIAEVPIFAAAPPFNELPLRDFEFEPGVTPELGFDEFVLINSIARVDDDPATPDPIDPVTPVDPDPIDPVDPAPADPAPAPVPTPSAALAGLLGVAAVAARRRR